MRFVLINIQQAEQSIYIGLSHINEYYKNKCNILSIVGKKHWLNNINTL